jgi:hypothetical protein
MAETPGYQRYEDAITVPVSDLVYDPATLTRDIPMTPLAPCPPIGGAAAGPGVTETIDTASCGSFPLLLSRQSPTATSGRLYISLMAPSVSEWVHYMWYRPRDGITPPYIQMVRNETDFIAGASEYYYSQGTLGGEDLQFEIGGLSGFRGLTLVFGTWCLEDGLEFNETNLRSIQRIQVSFQ